MRVGFASYVWENIMETSGDVWKLARVDPGCRACVSFWKIGGFQVRCLPILSPVSLQLGFALKHGSRTFTPLQVRMCVGI
ncbi:unnamed protein product [Linum trigynum]|uniref:Uncharacterized protein n=1 Tax=Linum trigynum TaxID=586398 RepID=A0AAV2DVN6_9ROSI